MPESFINLVQNLVSYYCCCLTIFFMATNWSVEMKHYNLLMRRKGKRFIDYNMCNRRKY